MSLVLTYTPDDDLKKYEPVTIATMTYFISLVLGLINSSYLLKYLPFTNVDLFKYFGNSFLPTGSNIGLDVILRSSLLPDTNIMFSSIIIGAFMLTLFVTSVVIFNKRDLN